ncbi:methyltransferase family protein [Rhizobium sp. PP-F2F-G20b]|nr:methyltransferase family protein [Rhizobium sp. PP-F2F-G20b]
MSGFETEWLALREPADKAARAETLMANLATFLDGIAAPTIMDIGCGTGSTYRSLAARLPDMTGWHLVDHDQALLVEAERRIGSAKVSYHRKDLSDLASLDLAGVTLVTASAFFDLCSPAFCDDLVERLISRGIGLYAALSYDGRIAWSDRHERDSDIVSAFNRHQLGDKGFGTALGPQAAEHLAAALASRGYRIETADSSWRLDRSQSALQEAFLQGMISPVTEVSGLGPDVLEAWLDFRLGSVHNGGRLAVGHIDLLALPR